MMRQASYTDRLSAELHEVAEHSREILNASHMTMEWILRWEM